MIIARSALIFGLALSLAAPAFAQSNTVQSIRYGTITGMEKTIVKDKSTGTGARTGATVGAVAGYALSSGRDRWLGALLGGALGGAAGGAGERAAKKKKGWQLFIKLEPSGEEIGIQVKGKTVDYGVGDRVRLMSAEGKTKVSKVDG